MLMPYDVLPWLLKEKANTKRRRYCINPYFNSLRFSSPFNNIKSKKITINYSLAWTAALNAEASWDPESTFPGSHRLPASSGDFKRSIYYLLVVTAKGCAALADLPRKHPAELVWSKASVWERRPDWRSLFVASPLCGRRPRKPPTPALLLPRGSCPPPAARRRVTKAKQRCTRYIKVSSFFFT